MSSREKKFWSICKLSLLSRLLLFSRSVVSDSFVIPWTVAHQAPLSSGFPRQEYWNKLPFPFPGDLPDLGIEPVSPALAGGFCTTEPPGTPTSLLLLLLSCFSRVRLCVTPWTAAHQAPLSLGFSGQEHWSGLPFPSPMHENEK